MSGQGGYCSDGDIGNSTGSRLLRSSRARKTPTLEEFLEMQEDERYGIWHPRYRVPKEVFGMSKPFVYRDQEMKVKKILSRELAKKGKTSSIDGVEVPGNTRDAFIQRNRDAFEKQPPRGTFSRADRSLPPDW